MLWLPFIAISVALAQDVTASPGMTRIERIPLRDPLFEVKEARGEFGDALDAFQKAFWVEPDRKRSAKRISQNVDVFLRYLHLRIASHDRPVFDPDDLKKLTKAQLSVELLKSSREIQPQLTRMVRTENSAVVPVEHWKFLLNLEAQLLRLKWLASRLM